MPLTASLAGHDIALLRGERLLFRDISFAVNAGEALLIEGDNGSGKTSLLRIIAGLMQADEGEVRWQGRNIESARQSYCSELAWYGHASGCKQDLSLIENLRFERSLRPQRSVSTDTVIERLGLGRLTGLPVRALSAGQQRRAALARLLLSAAPLWLLDEPFTNLDRAGRELVTEMLRAHLAKDGLGVIATHHGLGLDLPTPRLTLS